MNMLNLETAIINLDEVVIIKELPIEPSKSAQIEVQSFRNGTEIINLPEGKRLKDFIPYTINR